MNKLKFLFIVLLFGFVFVFNFSSAGQVSSSCSVTSGSYGDGLTLCIIPVPTLNVGSVYWSCQLVGFDGTIPSPSSDNVILPVQYYSSNGNSSLSALSPFDVSYANFFGGNSFSYTFNYSSAKLVYLSFNIRNFADWVSIGDNVSIDCVFSGNNLFSPGGSSSGLISGGGSSSVSLDSGGSLLDWFYSVGNGLIDFFTGFLNVLSYIWSIFQAMWYGLTTLLSGTYDLTYDVFNYGLF